MTKLFTVNMSAKAFNAGLKSVVKNMASAQEAIQSAIEVGLSDYLAGGDLHKSSTGRLSDVVRALSTPDTLRQMEQVKSYIRSVANVTWHEPTAEEALKGTKAHFKRHGKVPEVAVLPHAWYVTPEKEPVERAPLDRAAADKRLDAAIKRLGAAGGEGEIYADVLAQFVHSKEFEIAVARATEARVRALDISKAA